MQIWHESVGGIQIGHGSVYDKAAAVSVALIRRRNLAEGDIAYRFSLTLTWDWPWTPRRRNQWPHPLLAVEWR